MKLLPVCLTLHCDQIGVVLRQVPNRCELCATPAANISSHATTVLHTFAIVHTDLNKTQDYFIFAVKSTSSLQIFPIRKPYLQILEFPSASLGAPLLLASR